MGDATDADIERFIAAWEATGGSELANTQSFIGDLCRLIGVDPPGGSHADDARNDYVFERRVFQDNGDGTTSFGRIDCYRRGCFILEAKQGSDLDRRSAAAGEADLDLFGHTATDRMKRGTARRGTPAWARAMVSAKVQAERYAKALPVDHGWPPFLLVADIGYCIEVYADFTGTGKAYAQFPDRSRYRIMLADLRDAAVRERLRAIWTEPASLDPTARAARVTREIADLLATLARRLERRGHGAEQVSGFLMRLLFTMFAEDSALIPPGSFTQLLKDQRGHPEHLHHQLSALWAAMDKGEFAPALGIPLRRFNGYLFKDRQALPLEAEELDVLIAAATHVWTEVEPAIFGTLLERALDPKERSKLGAHYTPRAYVERLIGPTIIEPLRADWDGVRASAAKLIDENEPEAARELVEKFHGQLARTRVLDPACGTGNFLYVAMARMKELEGEVLDLLLELGDDQYVAELSGHTITPENFLGIEINPRAAEIAQLVLWIGYLQWHFRVNGADKMPAEPILRDIRTIENRDALIAYDDRVLERDEAGRPVSRWDGETMKPHPVTGKPVPDEDARVEVWRYVNPRPASWPRTDFIVGNPPFIGGKDVRDRLGDGYFKALFRTTKVPESADFVMHWWDKAATLVRRTSIRRFGFVTTNSITQTFSRRVIARHMEAKDRLSLLFAIPNHPWVDERNGAAVRIAMTVAAKGRHDGRLLTVTDESGAPETIEFREHTGSIAANLRTGADVTQCKALRANTGLAHQGVKLHGKGFILTREEATRLLNTPNDLGKSPIRTRGDEPTVIFPFLSGRDSTGTSRDLFVIDFWGQSEQHVRQYFPDVYQHLLTEVKPRRDGQLSKSPTADAAQYAKEWWLFGKPRPDFRESVHGLDRYIATVRTQRRRSFFFVGANVVPESRLVTIASDDSSLLAYLTSRFHDAWILAWGARLGVGDDPNYNNSECFDPFPFPADVPEPLQQRIRAEAEALDALRKRVLVQHADLTLTKLYNVLEALRADGGRGRALTDVERDIHDRGLVTIIRQHHDAIDELVADAYGWGDDWRAGRLDDETILARLVALNAERAAEEAKGLIRWLRPEYQAPDYRPPVEAADELALAGGAGVAEDNVIAWPTALPEQVSAVRAVLTSAPAPLAANDIARAFRGKRAASVRPVLDALTNVGLARRLPDGRYAA